MTVESAMLKARLVSERHPRPIRFWKSVGGSTYLIKWKGRWHWGHGVRFGLNFSNVARKHGYKLVRVKEPEALRRVWSKHGANIATLKKEFPSFDIEALTGYPV